jgi:drug/metabolite transporter (DMT)-like permease
MALIRDNTRGIIAMNVSMAAFNLSDALTKLATETFPLGETIFVRGVVAATFITLVVISTGTWREGHKLLDLRIAARLVGEIGATLFYLVALVHVALPNVSAVFQATPLAMTAAAALFLGEKVGPRRWAAIAVGFVGVLIIVQPGLEGFEPRSVLVLISVAFVVLRDIVTAKLGDAAPTSLVTLATALTSTALGLTLMPFEGMVSIQPQWIWPSLPQFLLLATIGIALLIGYVALIEATRHAETAAIAPYRYVLLVWSFFYGFTLFGDVPDRWTLLGAAIVVATGLYTFHRERVRRRLG